MPPRQRHLHRGLWKHSVPVAGAAATKLPAGAVHLCQIQDLTSESTHQPVLHALPAAPPLSKLASQSTGGPRQYLLPPPLTYTHNLDYLPHSLPRLSIFY